LPQHTAKPPRDDQPNGKNDQRPDDLKTVVGQKTDDFGFDQVNGLDCLVGCISHVSPQSNSLFPHSLNEIALRRQYPND
jgi:hypothetical protein